MTREEKRRLKYPDSTYFHYHNQNPKNKITSDCTYRAISAATGIDYAQVVREMADMHIKTGYDSGETRCIDAYLKSKGWEKQPCPKRSNNKRLTGKEFCSYLKPTSTVIMNIGCEHLSCIIKNQIWDTWDCSSYKVGNYWVKKAI